MPQMIVMISNAGDLRCICIPRMVRFARATGEEIVLKILRRACLR